MPNPVLKRSGAWPGIESPDLRLWAEFEQFDFHEGWEEVDRRWRPRRIHGAVWFTGGRGRQELVCLAEIGSRGTLDMKHPTYSIGGHLIAVMLNGVDEPENLVPVSSETNSKMLRVEHEIKKMAAGPINMDVVITSYWDDPDKDPRIPRTFEYRISKLGGEPLHKLDVTQNWLSPALYSFSDVSLAAIKQLEQRMREDKWVVENVANAAGTGVNLQFLAGHLPPPNLRPNAVLDYICFAHAGAGLFDGEFITTYTRKIALRTDFDEPVKTATLQNCIRRHDNRLISDVFGVKEAVLEVGSTIAIESHDSLIEGGGYNSPQIDHIMPRNMDGPNCFSNAQVTSMQYNTTKGDATQQLAFRSSEWKEQQMAKWANDPFLKFL